MPSDFAEWLDFRTFRMVRDESDQLTPLPSRSGERAFLAFDSQRLRYLRLHVFEGFAGDTEKAWWLRREMDAISRLDLSAKSEIIESGEDDEGLYYIDDFPGGEPVGEWLTRIDAISPTVAVSLTTQLIEILEAANPRPRAIEHFNPDLLWILPVGEAKAELIFADYGGWADLPLESETPLVQKLSEFLLRLVGGKGIEPQLTMLCETALSRDSPMFESLAGFKQALGEMSLDQSDLLTSDQLPRHFLHDWLIDGTNSTDESESPYTLGTSDHTGADVMVLPGAASVPSEFLHPQHLYGFEGEMISDGPRCRLLSENEAFSQLESLEERIERAGPQPLAAATALIEAVIIAADSAEPTVPIVSVAPADILYPPEVTTDTPTHFRLYPTTPRLIEGLNLPDSVSEALLKSRGSLPQARRSALALTLFWFVSTGKKRVPWDPTIRLSDDHFTPQILRLLESTRTRLAESPASDDGTLIEQLIELSTSNPENPAEPKLDLVTPDKTKAPPKSPLFGFSPNWSTVAACLVFSLSLASLAMFLFRSNPERDPPPKETGAHLQNRAPETKTAGGELTDQPIKETASSTVPTTVFPETALIQKAIDTRKITLPPSVTLPVTDAPAPGSTIDTTFPDTPREFYLTEANSALNEGAYGRSLNLCLEVLSDDPGRAEARILMTRTIAAWLSSGKAVQTFDEAELLREASETVPGAATLLVGYEEDAPIHWLARSASSGRVEHMREFGLQMQPDNPIAIEWLTRAADGGDLVAAYHLADRLIKGEGTRPDPERAVLLLETASRAGHGDSTNLLGLCHQEGWGTEIDLSEAYRHFIQGAVLNNADAQYNLANCHATGSGTERNLVRAAELYSLGAENGHPDSMFAWSKCLEHGHGVATNREEAFVWYERTANSGNLVAREWCRENGVALGLKLP